jgi:hypothetical protein
MLRPLNAFISEPNNINSISQYNGRYLGVSIFIPTRNSCGTFFLFVQNIYNKLWFLKIDLSMYLIFLMSWKSEEVEKGG